MACRYCENIFSKDAAQEVRVHDHILFETENFVAIPTLGSLVQGWLLIVSKEHRICMGDVNPSSFEELINFKNEVAKHVELHFGPVAIFEHGPSRSKQLIGCGVDHAHLHIVPTKCDLVAGLSDEYEKSILWTEVELISETIRCHAKGLDYLYIEQAIHKPRIATANNFGSQLFRKVIARYIRKPELFDWKTDAGLENVRLTIAKLSNQAASREIGQVADEVISS